MNTERDWREQLAFLASGTLGQEERAAVLARLDSDPEAAKLLRTAELLVAGSGTDPLDGPVDPLLLVEYAESPESLPAEVRAFIERRLESSELSRSALEHLRESVTEEATVSGTEAPAVERPTLLTRLWSALRASLLHPVPALAYLLLLAAVLPALFRGGAGAPAPLPAPVMVGITGEAALRDGAAGVPTPVLELPAPKPGQQLMLVIRTGLIAEDLEREDVGFRIVLSEGSRLRWSRAVDRREFRLSGSAVELPILVDAAGLRREAVHRLELRAEAPGDPLDGAALFVRRFVLKE